MFYDQIIASIVLCRDVKNSNLGGCNSTVKSDNLCDILMHFRAKPSKITNIKLCCFFHNQS